MKYHFLFLLLSTIILTSCDQPQTEERHQETPVQFTERKPPTNAYVIAVVRFSYRDRLSGQKITKTRVSDIVEGNMSDPNLGYRLMDKISDYVRSTDGIGLVALKIEKREYLKFKTYSEASIEREYILQNGLK